MELTRREFLKESLATLGFLALPGGLFAPLLGHPLRGQPSAGGYSHAGWTIAVRPVSSLGTKGKAIIATTGSGQFSGPVKLCNR